MEGGTTRKSCGEYARGGAMESAKNDRHKGNNKEEAGALPSLTRHRFGGWGGRDPLEAQPQVERPLQIPAPSLAQAGDCGQNGSGSSPQGLRIQLGTSLLCSRSAHPGGRGRRRHGSRPRGCPMLSEGRRRGHSPLRHS